MVKVSLQEKLEGNRIAATSFQRGGNEKPELIFLLKKILLKTMKIYWSTLEKG
jgi:hypothetical protein